MITEEETNRKFIKIITTFTTVYVGIIYAGTNAFCMAHIKDIW